VSGLKVQTQRGEMLLCLLTARFADIGRWLQRNEMMEQEQYDARQELGEVDSHASGCVAVASGNENIMQGSSGSCCCCRFGIWFQHFIGEICSKAEDEDMNEHLTQTSTTRINMAASHTHHFQTPQDRNIPHVPSTSSMSKNVKYLYENFTTTMLIRGRRSAPVHVSDARYNAKDTGDTSPLLQGGGMGAKGGGGMGALLC
jgi:hypothetical protein